MNEASNFCTGQVCVAPNTTLTAQHSGGEQPGNHSTCVCVGCCGDAPCVVPALEYLAMRMAGWHNQHASAGSHNFVLHSLPVQICKANQLAKHFCCKLP